MINAIVRIGLIAALAAPAAGAGAREPEPLPAPLCGPAEGTRDGSVELAYDDSEFEAVGTFPDWTSRSLAVFEMPPGGPWALTTLRLFMYGEGDHEVLLAAIDGLGPGYPPLDPRLTGIHFDPGRPDSADIGWVDVDIGSAGVVLNPGQLIAVGAAFADGGGAIGLDNACGYHGQCGHYWSTWNDRWIYEASYGYNLGLRVVLTGSTPTESLTVSALKSRY